MKCVSNERITKQIYFKYNIFEKFSVKRISITSIVHKYCNNNKT